MKNELYHHGILGMKWGVRRYQNPDGSLTLEGRRRYLKDAAIQAKKERKKDYKSYKTRGRKSSVLLSLDGTTERAISKQ